MIRHDGIEHAGYMAFLSLLSLFPFLVFLVALAGSVGESEIGSAFVQLLFNNLPDHVTHALEPRMREIISGPPQGLMTLAIVGAIWTASSAVEGLRTILNRVYRVTIPPPYIWRRLLSIVQFLVLTVVIVLAMVVLVLVPLIAENLDFLWEGEHVLPKSWTYIRYSIIGSILFLGIASLYYVIPNAKLSFRRVIPGAALVVVLWMGAGILFSMYLSHFQQVSLIYGSLGGIIVSLLFFYITNIIFILGAEFNFLLQEQFNK